MECGVNWACCGIFMTVSFCYACFALGYSIYCEYMLFWKGENLKM